jgi:hypothetical protein
MKLEATETEDGDKVFRVEGQDSWHSTPGEAIQAMWKPARKKPVRVEYREVRGETETIETLEGTLEAKADEHYIIRGVEGEIYPIEKDVFEETYERIDDDAQEGERV